MNKLTHLYKAILSSLIAVLWVSGGGLYASQSNTTESGEKWWVDFENAPDDILSRWNEKFEFTTGCRLEKDKYNIVMTTRNSNTNSSLSDIFDVAYHNSSEYANLNFPFDCVFDGICIAKNSPVSFNSKEADPINLSIKELIVFGNLTVSDNVTLYVDELIIGSGGSLKINNKSIISKELHVDTDGYFKCRNTQIKGSVNFYDNCTFDCHIVNSKIVNDVSIGKDSSLHCEKSNLPKNLIVDHGGKLVIN